jgi:alpha-ketoglutarate-dependent taurine dioxygenase
MLVLNNHRVLHGRRAFEGTGRNMIGAYIGLDEFESCLRLNGLPTDCSADV